MRTLFTLITIIFLSGLNAQDTLRVMHYNLLDYGNSGFCTNNTNNTDQKDAYLRAIISYVRPDIFTVNELSKLTTYHSRLLSEVMNQTGYALFGMANSPNIADSYIVNQLYYNSEKLALHSQVVAQSEVRDIDVYRLYYLSERLAEGDTVFIYCIVAHLKAGSGNDDEAQRAVMTNNTLNYLEAGNRPGNYLFMGDFNFYDSAEEAFQLMINNNDPVFRFYDPANAIGDWHEEYEFQHVHTQSTRGASSGCGASGGMDDRFDFILMNKVINDQAAKMYYLEGSYRAFGQDGNRLNGTIQDPPNTSLPAYLIDALYYMSDHLPVIMDLVIDESLDIDEIAGTKKENIHVSYNNPAKSNLNLTISAAVRGNANISLRNTAGVLVYHTSISLKNTHSVSIPIDTVTPGMYILSLEHEKARFTGKVIVIR